MSRVSLLFLPALLLGLAGCDAASSSVTLPRTGTPNTMAASASVVSAFTNASARYGATFPTTICAGRSGDTSSTSIVPRSFSRAMEIAVISAETRVRTNASRPGTKRFWLASVGLNRIRTDVRTSGGPPPSAAHCETTVRT